MKTYREQMEERDARVSVRACAICDKPVGRLGFVGDEKSDVAHSECHDRITKTTWEDRTCVCGYERRVKIRRAWRGGKDAEESWSRLCDACDHQERAAVHMAEAKRHMLKANEIRKRRGQ